MSTRVFQVDAFADRVFAGNPAGVCLLEAFPEDPWMQLVAREMNLAETAFLCRAGDGFDLRWFTPTVEVDLCGHATLASAHYLWEEGILDPGQEAIFRTRSGILTAVRRGDWIEMDFPADPPVSKEPPSGLLEALGARPAWCGLGRFDWLFQLGSEEEVRALEPDLGAIRGLVDRGVIVTSATALAGADFVSRFFAPAVGVAEDPATGSAHACLGPFWAERLGRRALSAYQASERGGWIRLEVLGDRVLLSGQAVTAMEIVLKVAPGEGMIGLET